MKTKKQINSLTIAGTDPTSGAGIQADLKTFSALGVYGCSVITVLVAQNTCGVQSIYNIEPNFVIAQIESVFSDVRIDSVKVGMLANVDIIETVSDQLKRYEVKNLVLDTVLLSKSGNTLLHPSAISALRVKLLPQADIITPNLYEAAALLETTIAKNENEIKDQGMALLELNKNAVLIKGGHLNCIESPDWLFTQKNIQRLTAPRVKTKNTHGTGCTLSAALAALRPNFNNWFETIQKAKFWLNSALKQADKLKVGNGNGPVHHFHKWW